MFLIVATMGSKVSVIDPIFSTNQSPIDLKNSPIFSIIFPINFLTSSTIGKTTSLNHCLTVSTNSVNFSWIVSHKEVAHSTRVSLNDTKTNPKIAAIAKYFLNDFKKEFAEKLFLMSPIFLPTFVFLNLSPSLPFILSKNVDFCFDSTFIGVGFFSSFSISSAFISPFLASTSFLFWSSVLKSESAPVFSSPPIIFTNSCTFCRATLMSLAIM